jgi:predicted RecB family endonuclease
MNSANLKVTKGSGEQVAFDAVKLSTALKRSGASPNEISQIIGQVESMLYEGISTKKIYQIAYSILRKKSHHTAGRYRLKKAIQELGPTGYPFEKFVGKLFEADGYKADVGIQVKGKCIQHEVDVVAKKPGKQIMVECKFHGDSSRRSDVKVALYIQSRFMDLKAAWEANHPDSQTDYKGMVVCNTRFSEDAMQFARCTGLELISWDYPSGNSLKDWIDRSGYHPITSLHSLKKRDKQDLLEEGIVLCRELKNHPDVLRKMGFNERQLSIVVREAQELSDMQVNF